MQNEEQQKKVALSSIVFVVGIVVLAALVAGCWYFLLGRKTNPETPRQQNELTAPADLPVTRYAQNQLTAKANTVPNQAA